MKEKILKVILQWSLIYLQMALYDVLVTALALHRTVEGGLHMPLFL